MIQIAFAGHNRAQDLGHHTPVIARLESAFELVKQAGIGQARLFTGLATGADRLAVAAWRTSGLGDVHAVQPFLDDPEEPLVGANGMAETGTWLDGAGAESCGRNPHLKQTRMIVEWADLLVVVWTGGPARGAGGTADAVMYAMSLGRPVLWIRPGEDETLRLIRTDSLPTDFYFPEFQEALHQGRYDHVEIASIEGLKAALGAATGKARPLAPPLAPWRAALDKWLHSWLWKSYSTFRRLLGGTVTSTVTPPPLPADLASQPGFQVLSAAYQEADQLANALSAVHRSEQLLLLQAMMLAALIGMAWLIWPQVHILAIQLELALAFMALIVTAVAARARQHERWGEERFLAEQLRLERPGWVLGINVATLNTAPSSLEDPEPCRDIRRAAGLPHGRYDPERVKAWGDWAVFELVQGQAAYHHANSHRDGHISHRLHAAEDVSFLFLIVLFTVYLALDMTPFAHGHHLPEWMTVVVELTATLVPALAAATMAIESKLGFQEQSNRSQRVAEALDRIAADMSPHPSFDALQNIARSAIRIHLAESTHWREGADRRRLFRP